MIKSWRGGKWYLENCRSWKLFIQSWNLPTAFVMSLGSLLKIFELFAEFLSRVSMSLRFTIHLHVHVLITFIPLTVFTTYPGFGSIKRLEVLLFLLGWDASPSQVTPQHFVRFPWVETASMHESSVSCPRTHHNDPARARTWTSRSRVRCTNH